MEHGQCERIMARLIWGVLFGLILGGAFAAVAIQGFGVTVLGALLAYAMAGGLGVLLGMFAGKPIWRKGAAIEAGLKSVFGVIASVGMMFALRRWGLYALDLSFLGLGQGLVGELAATAFPAISVALSVLFEVDNLIGKDDDSSSRKRIADDSSKVRVGSSESQEIEENSRTSKRGRA
jgi:hypothetical protein